MKKQIAILIPCFNESQTIEKVIKDYKRALPEAKIYVYDNNSSDNTGDIAKKAGAIVEKEYRQGKGNVVRSMFRKIDADCYIMVDGDDTYSAQDAKKMSELVLSGQADMVVGDRLSSTYFQENKRPFHNFGNRIVRFLISKIFNTKIKDVMTGYRALSYEFVKNCPILYDGFEIETEMTIHAIEKKYSIVEIPIGYKDRPSGSESKLNTVKDGIKVINTIISLSFEYKPKILTSILSIILLLIAILFFVFTFKNANNLIIACLFLLASAQSFAIGSIMQIINKKHRRNYELWQNKLYIERKKEHEQN